MNLIIVLGVWAISLLDQVSSVTEEDVDGFQFMISIAAAEYVKDKENFPKDISFDHGECHNIRYFNITPPDIRIVWISADKVRVVSTGGSAMLNATCSYCRRVYWRMCANGTVRVNLRNHQLSLLTNVRDLGHGVHYFESAEPCNYELNVDIEKIQAVNPFGRLVSKFVTLITSRVRGPLMRNGCKFIYQKENEINRYFMANPDVIDEREADDDDDDDEDAEDDEDEEDEKEQQEGDYDDDEYYYYH